MISLRKGSLYRIYPEQDQKQVLEQHFGGVRFLYNKLLHIKSILYS
ncbi:Mobile element protein [Methanosarcina lacustris Z-7289]|uniref:Mobile element protein n=1 Tax=Methanosarcina lacustris Z-7289 TaxID=1434111 RepID=A0A0E3WUH3_9EURY|nr:Mobile element protein [Methanosarcina lacustris Z-7289]